MDSEAVAAEILRRSWALGASVFLSPESTVDSDGIRVAGYFDEGPPPRLVVAWGADHDKRLGVLLHEYSHLTQWAEGAPVWELDRSAVWADWLAGKRVKNIAEQIASSRELEADCERRTVRLIKELGAPLDVERYCRAANSYVHFYNVMAVTRRWYLPGRGPYECPEVLAVANPTLDRDYSRTPKRLWNAIAACLEP